MGFRGCSRWFPVVLIITLVILAGCQQKAAAPPVAPPAPTTGGGNAEQPQSPPTPTPQPAPIIEPQHPAMTKKVTDLLAKAEHSRITGYQYSYRGPPDRSREFFFWVKGDKIKIKLPKPTSFNPATYFDTVYMDVVAQKAVGYCLDGNIVHCPNPDKEYQLDYNAYFKRTPYQWVKLIDYATEGGTAQIDGRATIALITEMEGTPTTLWVDVFYGLPLKVEQGSQDKIVEFRAFLASQVADADVTR